MSERVRVKFKPETTEEDREGFSVILELFGTVYRTQHSDEITILPNQRTLKTLREQLTVWEENGALSWSDAI